MMNKAGVIFSLLLVMYGHHLKAQNREATDKPNFIIILADDLGYGDLGITGSKQIKTPHIDQLAKSGIRFTQGYVSSAVCSPSRAGLLTGKHQVEFGYDNNLAANQKGFDPTYAGLPVDQPTIARRLKPLGYTTGLIGKWHLGYQPQFHPLKRGFDQHWGYIAGGHDYFTSEPDGKGYLAPIQSNYKTPQPISYLTDDKGDECVDFIKRNKQAPFFLFASFNAPHTPMQALEEDLLLYSHIEDENRRTYAAMVHRLDVNVGKIMQSLEDEGLSKNTIVVFLSDNGGPTDVNASINAPFNGQKGILLEGGIRVPLIINWPGQLTAGKVYEKAVSALDLAPTFFTLAGGKMEANVFTGVNLMPYLTNKIRDVPHDALLWRFTISAAIVQGDWKLVRIPDRLPMLYHLPTDESEQKDVSLQNLEKTRALLQILGNWDVNLPHPLFLEGAQWKARQLGLYDRKYVLKQPAK